MEEIRASLSQFDGQAGEMLSELEMVDDLTDEGQTLVDLLQEVQDAITELQESEGWI